MIFCVLNVILNVLSSYVLLHFTPQNVNYSRRNVECDNVDISRRYISSNYDNGLGKWLNDYHSYKKIMRMVGFRV